MNPTPGFQLRPARMEDADGIARVRVDTWREAYRGLLPADVLDNLSYEESAANWHNTLAAAAGGRFTLSVVEEGSGRLVGFATGGPDRTSDPLYTAEVYAIYILPEYQGCGLGRRLLAASARSLRQMGHQKMRIWMLTGNPTDGFYRKLGGIENQQRTITIGGDEYVESGYIWEELQSLADSTPPENFER